MSYCIASAVHETWKALSWIGLQSFLCCRLEGLLPSAIFGAGLEARPDLVRLRVVSCSVRKGAPGVSSGSAAVLRRRDAPQDRED
jgi:hypothetical protein